MKNDIFNDSFCYIQTIEKIQINTKLKPCFLLLFTALFIGSRFKNLNFGFEYVVLNIFIVVGQLALCWKVELASLTSDVHFQVKAFLNAVTTH